MKKCLTGLIWLAAAHLLFGCSLFASSGGGGTDTNATVSASPTPVPTAKPPIHQAAPNTTAPSGVEPYEICNQYQLDCGDSGPAGQGETIVVVEAYGNPTIQQDLEAFDDEFQYNDITLKIVPVPSASPGSSANDSTGDIQGWAGETSLDVEWAHAMAPNAEITVVEAASDSAADLLAAINKATSLGAHQISMSFGIPEGASPISAEGYVSPFNNTNGITFFASAGDQGTDVNWPAVDPAVIGVGGTTFTYNPNGDPVLSNEVAWGNSNNGGVFAGTGGGISAIVAIPSYQNSSVSTLLTAKRGVPDVAYNADPISGFPVYCTPSSCGSSAGMPWAQIGGTSAGSPQWAAIFADLNSQRGNTNPISNAITAIYELGAANASGSYFTDIVSGDNCERNDFDYYDGEYDGASCRNASYVKAAKGWDALTGWGSPIGANLISALLTK